MKKLLMIMVFGLFCVVLAGTAMAIPADLRVDFRDSDWAGAYGFHSYTVGDIHVTALPAGVVNAFLYQDSLDGFGVLGGENDEIDNINQYEQIFVNFVGGMNLTGVWLTDIFLSSYTGLSPSENYNRSDPTGEPGRVEIYDGSNTFIFDFAGIQSNTGSAGLNGELFVNFGGPINVRYALFSLLPDGADSYTGIEYSVAGFEGAVPEPATMLLLGCGLLGLFGIRRKFRK